MNVVIIGANRGIGLALVQEYLKRGEQVWAVCRTISPEIQKLEQNMEHLTLIPNIEITEDHSRQELLKNLPPQVDHFIHNAGILERNTIQNLDSESIIRQFLVNALAPLQTITTCLPHLQKVSKVGIVTSRMGSVQDNTSGSHYGYRMSKAAVNMAGVSLAHDVSDRGIGVYLLHPGYVKTDMTGGNGFIDTQESAQGLVHQMYSFTMEQTGTFWHTNGDSLPW